MNYSNQPLYQMNNCSSSNEKDMLISNLKSKIFQLDENEKAYCDLLNKFKNLQNEFQLMNEAKMRLEYELKQKSESYNKNLDELCGQNNSLTNELNDKNSMNQKLYADNNNLMKNLEGQKAQNDNLILQSKSK